MKDPSEDVETKDERAAEQLDIGNWAMWSIGADDLFMPLLPHRLIDITADQVLASAAWMVAMAEPFADHKFEEYVEAVNAT